MAPPPRSASRILLSRRSSFGGRERVYRTPEGLEIEESENFKVRCRRLFFDEVLAVTRHRQLGWPFLLVTAAAGAWFALLALGVGAGAGALAGVAAFALGPLPLGAAFVLRLAYRVDVVMVHGKRTRAQLHFWLRKRRADEIFTLLCRLARERQERVARDNAGS